MCRVWHADKYKIAFKLVINSMRISRGPVPDRGPAAEKHWFRGSLSLLPPFIVFFPYYIKKLLAEKLLNCQLSNSLETLQSNKKLPGNEGF